MTRIKIIYTGGTIGGDLSKQESSVLGNILSAREFEDSFLLLTKHVLRNVEILPLAAPILKFSEDITPDDWPLIAKAVFDAIVCEKVEGVVIAHGTDTLPYTAAALSFMLRGLRVPVVVTGSNLPMLDPKTDAIRNLADSVALVVQGMCKGVFVVFSGDANEPSTVHLGTRVRKRMSARSTFVSVGVSQVAHFENAKLSGENRLCIDNHELLTKLHESNVREPVMLANKIKGDVAFYEIYPGFDPCAIVDGITERTAGIILDLYSSGTGCTVDGRYGLIPALRAASESGVPVFATSQHEGMVTMQWYDSSVKLKKAGVISLSGMTKEAAIPKLIWARGIYPDRHQNADLSILMQKNVACEVSCSD